MLADRHRPLAHCRRFSTDSWAVRATGTTFGHTMETQFPLGIGLAALSISRGALFAPNDPTGLEVEMSEPPSQIVVIGAGHWRGEGMALVEAIK